jgi:hypothetical protein
MKIAIIGCSHSGGVYHRDTLTSGSMAGITLEGSWPLAIARANPQSKVILRPQPGGDVHSLNMHFQAVMEEYDPTVFVMQLPQSTRTSFGTSKTSDFDVVVENFENIIAQTLLMKSTSSFLTSGNVDFANTHWYIKRRVDTILNLNPSFTEKEIQNFLKVLRNIHNQSDYHLFQQGCTISGWIDACLVRGKRIIIMNWNEWDEQRFERLSAAMQGRIEEVLVNGGMPFMTWLTAQRGTEWIADNLIDDAHLNARAQALVLDFLQIDPRASKLLGLD